MTLDYEAITRGTLDPIRALHEIPRVRVQHMQRTLAAHANVMQYYATAGDGASGGGETAGASRHDRLGHTGTLQPLRHLPDAYDVAMEQVARRVTSRVIAEGKRLQGTAGAQLIRHVRIFERLAYALMYSHAFAHVACIRISCTCMHMHMHDVRHVCT